MANIQQVDKIETKFGFVGEFCEIRLHYLDKVSTAPVIVQQPQMKVEKKIDDKFEDFTLDTLVPLSPSNAHYGEYRTTFFSDNLEPGIYKITFQGFYPDNTKQENVIEISSEFEIFAINEFQGLLMSLRIQLADNKPELYWIDDTDKYRWDDGELFNAVKWSMDTWNGTEPISASSIEITKDNILNNTSSVIGNIMQGAEFWALNQKYNLENWNQFQYSDGLTFNVNRAPGIMSKLQLLKSIWFDTLSKRKKDFIIRFHSNSRGIKSTRIPLRMLKQLSFVPQFSFLANGGY